MSANKYQRLTKASGPSSMLLLVQGFQLTCGGDQGTTPAPLWRCDGSNIAIFPWTRDTELLGSAGWMGLNTFKSESWSQRLYPQHTDLWSVWWLRWLTGEGMSTPSSWTTLASCCCRSGDTLTSYTSNWTQNTGRHESNTNTFLLTVSQFCVSLQTYNFSFLLLGDSWVRLDHSQVVKLSDQRQCTRLSCQLLVGAVLSSCDPWGAEHRPLWPLTSHHFLGNCSFNEKHPALIHLITPVTLSDSPWILDAEPHILH